uniref:C2H2-type domain-containing protein n=1 Tax=Pectinophora gossypiella TaxID=13191 RepID=A0A1E1WTP9_PECGO
MGPEDRSYILETYCGTCLSKDRKLVNCSKLVKNMDIYFESKLMNHLNKFSLCWECHQVLQKVYKFNKQAKQAMLTLDFLFKNRSDGKSIQLKSLSVLHVNTKADKINIASQVFLDNHDIAETSIPKDENVKESAVSKPKGKKVKRRRKRSAPSNAKKNCDLILKPTKEDLESEIPCSVYYKKPAEDDDDDKRNNDDNIDSITRDDEMMPIEFINCELDTELLEFPKPEPVPQLPEPPKLFPKPVKRAEIIEPGSLSPENEHAKVRTDLINLVVSKDNPFSIAETNNIGAGFKMLKVQNTAFPLKVTSGPSSQNLLVKPVNVISTSKSVVDNSLDVERGDLTPHTVQARTIDYVDMLQLREKERQNDMYQEATYKCEKCLFGYKNANFFRMHMKQHDEEYGSIKCDICQLRFNTNELYDQHKRTHFVSNIQETEKEKNIHKNNDEGKIKQDLLMLRCKYKHCGRIFDTYKDFIDHEAENHDWIKDRKPKFRFKCSVKNCNKAFRFKNTLKIHIMEVHEKKIFHCKKCNRTYKSGSSYRSHLMTSKNHGVTASYECDYCGKKFIIKSYLALHINVAHTKMTQYPCDFCDEKFYSYYVKNRHMKTKHHSTPLKLVECNICGKTYKSKAILRKHQSVHTGEKPYHCPYCDWKFTQCSTLKTHCKLKHKDKPVPVVRKTVKTQNTTEANITENNIMDIPRDR